MDDENICPTCLDEPQYPCKLPCKHIFCYMCIKRVAETNKPCPKCQAIIPGFILEKYKTSEKSVSLTTEKWVYSGRVNGWWYYSLEDNKIIEDCWNMYQKYGKPSSVNLPILGRDYKIDFRNMTQTGESATRKIKRVKDEDNIHIKGVIGMQIVKDEDLPKLPDPEWKDPEQYNFDPEAWEDEYLNETDEEHNIFSLLSEDEEDISDEE